MRKVTFVKSQLIFEPRFYGKTDRQKKSDIPYLNFSESRFPGRGQIPNPVKIFCVFPNLAPFLGKIPDPKNTLPDPASKILLHDDMWTSEEISLTRRCKRLLRDISSEVHIS